MPDGGAYLAAGIINTAGQIYANQQTLKNNNRWNDIQVELANTAHQREVADLRAAGLNPVLSASGSGSSVPNLTGTDFANPGEGLSQGINNAVAYKEAQARIDNLKATNENLKNQGSLYRAQAFAVNAGLRLAGIDPKTGEPLSDRDLPEVDIGPITSGAQSLGEKVGSFFTDHSSIDLPLDKHYFNPITGKDSSSYEKLWNSLDHAYGTSKWKQVEEYLKNRPDSDTSIIIRHFLNLITD